MVCDASRVVMGIMASSTETIFWPLVAGLGLGFVILTIMSLSQAEKGVQFHTSEQISHSAARSTILTFLSSESSQPGGSGDDSMMKTYNAISLCWGGIDSTYDRQPINNPPGVLKFTQTIATRKGSIPSPEEGRHCPTDDGDYGDYATYPTATLTKGDPPMPWILGGQHTGSISGTQETGGVQTFRVKVPTGAGGLKTIVFRYEADPGAY